MIEAQFLVPMTEIGTRLVKDRRKRGRNSKSVMLLRDSLPVITFVYLLIILRLPWRDHPTFAKNLEVAPQVVWFLTAQVSLQFGFGLLRNYSGSHRFKLKKQSGWAPVKGFGSLHAVSYTFSFYTWQKVNESFNIVLQYYIILWNKKNTNVLLAGFGPFGDGIPVWSTDENIFILIEYRIFRKRNSSRELTKFTKNRFVSNFRF